MFFSSEDKSPAREYRGASRAAWWIKAADGANEHESWAFVGRLCWPPRLYESEHIYTADFRQTQVPLPTAQTKSHLFCSYSQLDQKLYEHSEHGTEPELINFA